MTKTKFWEVSLQRYTGQRVTSSLSAAGFEGDSNASIYMEEPYTHRARLKLTVGGITRKYTGQVVYVMHLTETVTIARNLYISMCLKAGREDKVRASHEVKPAFT